jgi:hypothetical protein
MIVLGSRLAGTSGRHRRSLGSKYLLMFPVGYLGALSFALLNATLMAVKGREAFND